MPRWPLCKEARSSTGGGGGGELAGRIQTRRPRRPGRLTSRGSTSVQCRAHCATIMTRRGVIRVLRRVARGPRNQRHPISSLQTRSLCAMAINRTRERRYLPATRTHKQNNQTKIIGNWLASGWDVTCALRRRLPVAYQPLGICKGGSVASGASASRVHDSESG